MKRYLTLILAGSMVLTLVGIVGCARDEPITLPGKPSRSEEQMTYALYEYFNDYFDFDRYWAQPHFFTYYDEWSASYDGAGMWLVKAYDIDGSYAGAWLVPEAVYYGGDYGRVEPCDDEAKLIASGARRIAEMPPRPPFLRLSNSPREDMIRVVQQYIASMSRKEVEEAFVTEVQQAIRSYYPLDWRITYTDSLWIARVIYYECEVIAYIVPSTGQIKVSGSPIKGY